MINAGPSAESNAAALPIPVGAESIYPQAFSADGAGFSAAADVYLREPSAARLAHFFQTKCVGAIKEEDLSEKWYDDWLAYQAAHHLYASVLSPKAYSAAGGELDLLRLTRFLEVFAYFSPAHGYSLQVSFLGLFSILMGSNATLKQQAVALLESGGLLAFGVSEKDHGSDLLGNEFTVREDSGSTGQLIANGSKYYIGNANVAGMISILARKVDGTSGRDKRNPFALIVLRPRQSTGFRNVRKIRTLGIRAAYVGELEVKDQTIPAGDVAAEGRQAWDAVFGTVTLGKFFLGFGSIGMCEHAFAEAADHLRTRILYDKPVIEMPHIRSAVAQAYARLTAMKLFAYRALDYVHAAAEADRRYLLFNAVQKAQVSTDGLKVMALLSDCLGAKGFESDTYFEMALRDTQLIPRLEGSAHINLALATRFIPRYFGRCDPGLAAPQSLVGGQIASRENPYLMQARTGSINSIAFPGFLLAYQPLLSIANVRTFTKQILAARRFLAGDKSKPDPGGGQAAGIHHGQCLAVIAYGQLIAENCLLLGVAAPMVDAIFRNLVNDLSTSALALAAETNLDISSRAAFRRAVAVPCVIDVDFVANLINSQRPPKAMS